jgi:hypothetical protein
MQTGTASTCAVCVMHCEQRRKRERSDNKPKFRHKHLRAFVVRDELMLNTIAARIDLRQRFSKSATLAPDLNLEEQVVLWQDELIEQADSLMTAPGISRHFAALRNFVAIGE